MKLRVALCLWAAATASSIAAAQAPLPPAAPSSLVPADTALRGFDQQVMDAIRDYQVPGVAISVVVHDRVILSRGYGVRDPATQAPMTENTLFPIFSMTKQFTSFGVGLLVDEGRLSFDAPLSSAVPQLRMSDPIVTAQVSIRDLLAHRSGLADHWFVGYNHRHLTRDELIRRLPHLSLNAPLRTRFQYNNYGYALAGYVTEQVSGMPWERFTQDRILTPLGMTRSTFSSARAEADPDHMGGVMLSNGRIVNTPMSLGVMPPFGGPAGGLFSTARDLSSWMRVHLGRGRLGDRQIIRPETLDELHNTAITTTWSSPAPERIRIGAGLGWYTEVYRGEPLLQHGGNHWGVSTLVVLLPRLNIGIVILANQDQSQITHALARTIADRLMGSARRPWIAEGLTRQRALEAEKAAAMAGRRSERVAGTRPSRPLADFAGTYVHPGYGAVEIAVADGRLVVDRDGERSPLEHWHYDVFSATTDDPTNLWAPEGENARLSFISDADGRLSALRISSTEEGVTFARNSAPSP